MEPLESDTQFTRSLLLVLEDAQRIERFVAEPYKSDDRGKRSAMLTLRNRMRQVVGDLEAAIVAARRIGQVRFGSLFAGVVAPVAEWIGRRIAAQMAVEREA